MNGNRLGLCAQPACVSSAKGNSSSAVWWPRVREAALELISPTRCASCERPGALICDDCLRAIIRIDPALSCTRCGAPFGSLLCTECTGEERDVDWEGDAAASASEVADERANEAAGEAAGAPASEAAFAPTSGYADATHADTLRPRLPALDRCLARTVFEGPPERVIRAYKDAGEHRLAPEIAALMLEAAQEAEKTAPERYGGMLAHTDAIAFVPATAAAYRRRGFDHMEAVARAFAMRAGLPLLDALVKHGNTDQRDFNRAERLAQAARAYEVVLPVKGARLLLLDDVITTGATLTAAAAALKQAGAAHVDGLAFARVW